MQINTCYPGSFGELIQGKVNDLDLLVSFPVNLYTEITLLESNQRVNIQQFPKMQQFLINILKEWNYEAYIANFDVAIKSQIPIGKGFASSTADLTALYYALIKMFKREFNQEELRKNCILVEPTDSTIFSTLTFFDYKKGSYYESIGEYFKFYILAFEGEKGVDTIQFNQQKNIPLADISHLYSKLKDAIRERDLAKIGLISQESIKLNQPRLNYQVLEEIIRLSNQTGGYGVIGAHSGNALGIIYRDLKALNHGFNYVLKNCNLPKHKIFTLESLNKEEFRNLIEN